MAAINPLIIGPKEREKIARLKDWAERNALSHDVLLRLHKAPPTHELLERNKDQTIHLPAFYQVVFTHEEQAPGVMCRRISISVKDDNCAPNVPAVNMIAEAFGFKNRVPEEAIFWIEPLGRGRSAINVLEPLDGDLKKLKRTTPNEGQNTEGTTHGKREA